KVKEREARINAERAQDRAHEAKASAEQAKAKEREALLARDDAKRQLERARLNAYLAHITLAQREWNDNHIARVRELLGGDRPRGGETDLRGFEWYYLRRLCNSELLTLRGHVKRVAAVAYSPDGKRIASGGFDDTVKVWDAATGQEAMTLSGH